MSKLGEGGSEKFSRLHISCAYHADVTLNPCLRNFRMRSIERASHADRFEDKCLISKSYIHRFP